MKNSNNSICPKCSSAIPADAPDGLCPKCALEGAATVWSPTTGGKRTPPPRIEEIAPHFPDLELLELLGAGGMGAVYKARQTQLDRFVALKILSYHLADDPAFVERFNREAKVLARLSHPNIVAVFDFGTAGPFCYLLMEYVDGVNLRQAMQAGRFTPGESLAMAQHICSALQFAHEEGILHRDIKPENILIDSKGRVKIADFGIAKLVGESLRPDVTLTMQGSVLGSPHYMAPEQIETPGDVDQRADIYSLGVVLYEMLTGELPIGRFALPSEKAAMDARIDEIVLRTLAKERQARFQTAGEVGTRVEAVANTAVPDASAPASMPIEPGMARFSLLSAILTGASLISSFLFLWLWSMTLTASFDHGDALVARELAGEISERLGLAVLIGFVAGASGIVGIILGCVALGKIRKSGGQLSGFGLAAFAAVTWPLLLACAFGDALMPVTPPGGPVPTGLFVIITLVTFALSSVFLVRGLARWAKGIPDGTGGKSHPGFGAGASIAAAIMFLGPLVSVKLAAGIFGSFEDEREGIMAEVREAQRIANSMIEESDSAKNVVWRLGKPEVTVALAMQEGQKATLRAFLRDAGGNTWDFNLGDASYRPELPRAKVIFEFGTELYDTMQRLVITRSVPDGRLIRSLEDLRGWEFNGALPEVITFDSVGKHQVQIAANKGRPAEVLILEVVVTQ